MTEKFHYTTSFGDEVVLPRFENVPVGVIRKLRKADTLDQTFGIIEAIADEASLEAIDKIGAVEFEKLGAAWRDDSGVKPGESSASSTS